MIELLDKTGFKTVTEYFEETTHLDRVFLQKALEQYGREKRDALDI